MPIFKEQPYQRTSYQPYESSSNDDSATNKNKTKIYSWFKNNWKYIAGVIGFIILICIGIYLYMRFSKTEEYED